MSSRKLLSVRIAQGGHDQIDSMVEESGMDRSSVIRVMLAVASKHKPEVLKALESAAMNKAS